MRWLARLRNRRTRKAIRALPHLHRGRAKFLERYPHYAMGIGSYGMPTVHDWQEGSTLRIGAYCSIADQVLILLGGHHRTDWVSSFPFPVFVGEAASIPDHGTSRGDVIIGNDVWLCSRSTILSGVTIGDGAVVAAGAMVTQDVPPYAIVAGNPARLVRWRFDEEQREALLATRWWDWPEAEIRRISPLMCSDDIDAFLAYAQQRRTTAESAMMAGG